MADYNVNMKQWNGSSFDNVLPLAFNSKALEGKSYDDIIQYAKSRDLMLYAGQYTGTGTYGSSNPTTLTFPFETILLICPASNSSSPNGYIQQMAGVTNDYTTTQTLGVYCKIRTVDDGKKIQWYTTQTSSSNGALYQLNQSGYIYYYAAIGGYDMGGQIPVGSTYTITSSQSWKVPATGRWMLELYGRGGNGFVNVPSLAVSGGASCQHYDSITLAKGDVYQVVIGDNSNNVTKFGTYSVNNATKADNSTNTPGTGTGNYGANGVAVYGNAANPANASEVYSSGDISKNYGYGGGYQHSYTGGPGAVCLKYLGE